MQNERTKQNFSPCVVGAGLFSHAGLKRLFLCVELGNSFRSHLDFCRGRKANKRPARRSGASSGAIFRRQLDHRRPSAIALTGPMKEIAILLSTSYYFIRKKRLEVIYAWLPSGLKHNLSSYESRVFSYDRNPRVGWELVATAQCSQLTRAAHVSSSGNCGCLETVGSAELALANTLLLDVIARKE
jgi:hypothetical protein